MKNVMIDLETMGTDSNSAIIALGAVEFGSAGLGEEFYSTIALSSSTHYGLKINPDTIMWWMQQSDEARGAFKREGDSLFNVLNKFITFLSANPDVKVWGCGSDFDNVILANAYKAVNLAAPWKFYNNRCYRTMKGLFNKIPIDRIGAHHNALDDAKSQAEHLVRIFGSIAGKPKAGA